MKKYFSLTLTVILINICCWGQNITNCSLDPIADTTSGKVNIICSFVNLPTQKEQILADKIFETKYNLLYDYYYHINYDDPLDEKSILCVENYNRIVGKYLDMRYGKSWRTEVRNGTPGL